MKKLRNNQCGYKLKDYFKIVFLSYIEKILSYLIKLRQLKKKVFYPILRKYNFFSYEHRVYILMGFKSHIEKIKHSSSIYIVNFDLGQ